MKAPLAPLVAALLAAAPALADAGKRMDLVDKDGAAVKQLLARDN